MNKKSKLLKIILFITIPFLFFLFILIFVFRFHSVRDLGARFLCSDQIVNETANQDNTYKAIVYVRNCGSTTSLSTHVAITKVNNKIHTNNEIILTSDIDNGKESSWEWGGPEVQIEWKNNTELFLLMQPESETFTKKTEYKGIDIIYDFLAPANTLTYESEKYVFEYPESYTVSEDAKVLTVSNEKGRAEIFKMSDFNGFRFTGASSTGEEEFEYKFTPKKEYQNGDFTISLFYLEGDEQTEKELDTIFTSFVNRELIDWQRVDLGDFTLQLPPEWKMNELQGIDSFVGEFVGDGVTLNFDYGKYSDSLVDEKNAKHTVTYETINGYEAKMVVPTVPGKGITGVYFKDLKKDGNTLQISTRNITAAQQETVLKIFRTIKIAE